LARMMSGWGGGSKASKGQQRTSYGGGRGGGGRDSGGWGGGGGDDRGDGGSWGGAKRSFPESDNSMWDADGGRGGGWDRAPRRGGDRDRRDQRDRGGRGGAPYRGGGRGGRGGMQFRGDGRGADGPPESREERWERQRVRQNEDAEKVTPLQSLSLVLPVPSLKLLVRAGVTCVRCRSRAVPNATSDEAVGAARIRPTPEAPLPGAGVVGCRAAHGSPGRGVCVWRLPSARGAALAAPHCVRALCAVDDGHVQAQGPEPGAVPDTADQAHH